MPEQCLWCCHNDSLESYARVHPVHVMNAEYVCRPLDQACGQLGNYIHHRNLLLLRPKADTHFIIPRRVEG